MAGMQSRRSAPSRRPIDKAALAVILSCFALAPAIAAPAAARIIAADWGVAAGPHPQSPCLVVGAGRANEGLRADWQGQLALVQREIGFKYLRMHGLLHDDMGVYAEAPDGRPVYNFQYIDALYDALLARRIRPFVELSFMPSALASGKQTVFWWKGNITPPRDMAKWSGLIRALIRHWKERYGEAEITRWYYEVWNEPDMVGLFFTGSLEDYLNFYRVTAEAIKAECPGCRVGGPASAFAYRYEQALVAYCAARHVPIDFVSTHQYGVEKGYLDETGTAGTRLSPNRHVISDRMRRSRELIERSPLPRLDLHFTEWSSAYTPTDPIHDQYHQAAFMLEQIRGAASAVDSMSYWTFTDIFEENGPPKAPFHGGFGLLNLQGIRKPAFFAYRFLAQLGPTDLRTEDPDCWVTQAPDGTVAALFWDYTPVVPPPGQNDQAFYRRRLPPRDLPEVTLSLRHLPPGPYRVSVYRIGYGCNDAYDAYLDLGAPHALTPDQVARLNAAASGAPFEEGPAVVPPDGRFERSYPMRTNDVYFITLKPRPVP